MKPATSCSRRWFDVWLSVLAATLLAGCTSPLLLTSSDSKEVKELTELEPDPEDDGVLLVKDVSMPWGLNYIAVEGVGLVTGLDKTGSDPRPSPQRTALISDMQTYEVKNPNMVLASAETSLVSVAFLHAGRQEAADQHERRLR